MRQFCYIWFFGNQLEENLSTYKSSGVDIKAGEETVNKIKDLVKSTHNKNVLSGIGYFGSFFEIDKNEFENPVLVSSVDGVGTKLKIAFMMDKHDTIGQDLVNHCVNDIAVCGAEPKYFLDYLAFGKLYPYKAEQIVSGFAKACAENNVALVGGETAEMPGIYDADEYDMSGTVVGIVEKSKIINGENTAKGDLLIGFRSTGLHTNGYSLARNVLFNYYKVDDIPEELDLPLGEELLKIHKSYLSLISKLKVMNGLKAFSHITGGGIIGNTKRVVPQNLSIKIDWDAWEVNPIFKLIQKLGEVPIEDMRSAFNMGIGLIAVVDKNSADEIINLTTQINEPGIVIGEISEI